MHNSITCLLLLLLTITASAEEKKKLYKWTDKFGNIHYSDTPIEGGKEIEMKLAPATKMEQPKLQPIENLTVPEPGEATDASFYQSISLTEPSNNGVVRNNASSITLTANLQPALYKDHSILFFVDGKPAGDKSSSLSLLVENVEYGKHSASVVVVDAQGKQIKSSSTVHFDLLHNINPKIRQQQKSNRLK